MIAPTASNDTFVYKNGMLADGMNAMAARSTVSPSAHVEAASNENARFAE